MTCDSRVTSILCHVWSSLEPDDDVAYRQAFDAALESRCDYSQISTNWIVRGWISRNGLRAMAINGVDNGALSIADQGLQSYYEPTR